jgi:hypothetical protein
MFCLCICYISCINERYTVYSSSLLLRAESPGQDSLGRHANQCATPHSLSFSRLSLPSEEMKLRGLSHLYICDLFYIFSGSVRLFDQAKQVDRSWENINRSQMYEYGEYGKWVRGHAV